MFCSGSLFTNSNWFAFEDDATINERSTGAVASPSPDTQRTGVADQGANGKIILEDDDLADTASSEILKAKPSSKDPTTDDQSKDCRETEKQECDKPPEWVEWRESSDLVEPSSDPMPNAAGNAPNDTVKPSSLPNGELQVEFKAQPDEVNPKSTTVDASPSPSPSPSPSTAADIPPASDDKTEAVVESHESLDVKSDSRSSKPSEVGDTDSSSGNNNSPEKEKKKPATTKEASSLESLEQHHD